ncbi:BadF/BadG/BcrA/BcrD ATPase family protein [Chitinophaga costaii]|uniref:BadF/BadG/BcrA/BcrD ATPase family protein n=2 Tax=Chitinophaga costaii TaxID=1335309 RepID=A0A1C4D824_9BACT|nr:BadF/BadG/BcrA/BcrD ATPase family protein [Chitinophaga costaii]
MQVKTILVADSGSTKTDWCLVEDGHRRTFSTQGISPYFQTPAQVQEIIQTELVRQYPALLQVHELYFYGTGLLAPANARMVEDALQAVFTQTNISVNHDLMGAARGLCGRHPGVVSILGTGSNSCFYDGITIVKNNPGLGYVLGDEGSGAYLGKRLLQYYLYDSFDEELKFKFDAKYQVTRDQILENVYRKPLANRYLASFAGFLTENRGHFLIENALEDGINEFFFNHLYKYRESWTSPLYFSGGIAHAFRDVIQTLCELYELQLGTIVRSPLEGLVNFHGE